MSRQIAFLRAINVGGRFVKMDRLRSLFEEMGFANAETFIASGNVVFDTDESDPLALQTQIEDHLRAALGFDVTTFLRTLPELSAVASYPAFLPAALETARVVHVAFLYAHPGAAEQEKLMAFCPPTDELAVHGREVYWLCRTSTHESPFSGAVIERALGMPATLRSQTTVQKMAAKYAK